jgi:hypothetical protein
LRSPWRRTASSRRALNARAAVSGATAYRSLQNMNMRSFAVFLQWRAIGIQLTSESRISKKKCRKSQKKNVAAGPALRADQYRKCPKRNVAAGPALRADQYRKCPKKNAYFLPLLLQFNFGRKGCIVVGNLPLGDLITWGCGTGASPCGGAKCAIDARGGRVVS